MLIKNEYMSFYQCVLYSGRQIAAYGQSCESVSYSNKKKIMMSIGNI